MDRGDAEKIPRSFRSRKQTEKDRKRGPPILAPHWRQDPSGGEADLRGKFGKEEP